MRLIVGADLARKMRKSLLQAEGTHHLGKCVGPGLLCLWNRGEERGRILALRAFRGHVVLGNFYAKTKGEVTEFEGVLHLVFVAKLVWGGAPVCRDGGWVVTLRRGDELLPVIPNAGRSETLTNGSLAQVQICPLTHHPYQGEHTLKWAKRVMFQLTRTHQNWAPVTCVYWT